MILPGNGRIGWVDAAKGFAIFAIVVGHFSACFVDSVDVARFLFRWTDTFHVPLFFLLTGLTMRDGWMGADKLRAFTVRCFLPYLVAGSASLLVCFLFVDDFNIYDRLFGLVYGAGAFRDNIMFGDVSRVDAIGIVWFLPALFFGKVLASAISSFPLAVRLFVSGGLFIVGACSSSYLFLPLDIQQGMCACWFITCGSVLKNIGVVNLNYGASRVPYGKVITSFVCFIGVVYMVSCTSGILEEPMYCNSQYHHVLLDMMGCVCSAVLVCFVIRSIYRFLGTFGNALEWAGVSSLALFAVHAVSLAPGDDVKGWLHSMVASGADPVGTWLLFMFMDIIICIGACILMGHVRTLRYVFYGKGGAPVMMTKMEKNCVHASGSVR